MTYKAPVRDLMFSLDAAADYGRLAALFPHADADTTTAVLEGAGALAADVLAPINRIGDVEGAKLENGVVRTAAGFPEAYKQFATGGWNGLSAAEAHGGQGLPRALEVAVFEMIQGSNMAFGLCPMLTLAAIEALSTHGTARQQSLYLPKLVSGEWTGTMNLTEPQAGSDLGAITTRADPDGEGGTRSTARRSTSPGATTTSPTTSSTSSSPACPTPLRARAASPCSCAPSAGRRGRRAGRGNASRRQPGAQARRPRLAHLRHALRGRQGGAGRRAEPGPRRHVRHDERGPAAGRRPGRRHRRARLSGRPSPSLERKQGRSAWTGALPSRLFDHPDVRRTLMLMKARIEAARGLCLATAVPPTARLSANPLDRDDARCARIC